VAKPKKHAGSPSNRATGKKHPQRSGYTARKKTDDASRSKQTDSGSRPQITTDGASRSKRADAADRSKHTDATDRSKHTDATDRSKKHAASAPAHTHGQARPKQRRADRPGRADVPDAAPAFDCKVARRCGACQLLALPYDAQLNRKQHLIEELFADTSCPVSPIIGMEDPLHYRDKVISPFAPGPKGRILTGMYASGTHRIVETDGCLIENETAQAIIRTVRALMPSFRQEPYDEDAGTGFLRHVQVRVAHFTGEVMVTLITNRREFPGSKNYVKTLRARHPEITTIVQNVNTRQTNVILGEQEHTLYGPGFIVDELCGMRFRISSRAFYQVNPVQAERLYKAALDLAQLDASQEVIDAYCGTGTIGLIASARAGHVIGVEENHDAIRDAQANARLNKVGNIDFEAADAGTFMRDAAAESAYIDTVLMDPPRSGADERFLASLVALAPACISYISCNPTTQKRDADYLATHGYRLERIQPVDMFPFTDHVENVALLKR